ncbi:DUF1109 domain-containing protein [Bordetella genomosp. 13]|uniref:Anti-sigma F factor n=1 Tax=Bordetella genomosp. 13 TaxID=463040 RepID=A0A1W6Z738_9BORD|nr:DUF1109 domain-containing protein [Bordetella genomosp. 13]ARP93236.1 anti-sigma F factor [Bordetella genomosp. 13]
MKTSDMVTLLASGVEPVDRRVVPKRFALAILAGGLGSALLMVLMFGPRPDLVEVMRTPLFWAKVAFPLCLAAAALWVAARLSRPGVAVGAGWVALAVPLVVTWLASAFVLLEASAGARVPLVLGSTWRTCPVNIALLSIPSSLAAWWAIKGLAPTRPRLAGAAGGLLAGAVATVAYCLHCPEMQAPFWAVWYVLGMLVPTALGALLGPRLLRW